MANKISCALLVLYSCISWTFVDSKALRTKRTTARDQVFALRYLTNFGYLNMPDVRAGQLRTVKELREAIKLFQLYAGLQMTGVVDDETMQMMDMPRCGMPDRGRSDRTKRRRKRYAVQGSVWHKKKLTYMVEGGPDNGISESEVEKHLEKAFKEWERVSALKFVKSTDPKSDILVRFRSGMHSDGYPFDGVGGTLAHGFYPEIDSELAGDVHFDNDETWILTRDKQGTDFYWTALHEIGHSLGLDHSNYQDAVMFPFYTGFKDNLVLNDDDVKGIRYLYGMRTINVKTAPASEIMPTSHPSGMPHACSTRSFDAIFADINRNTYFLSGKYFWIVRESGMREGPFEIKKTWKELPDEGVTAAYESEGKITFFQGKNCWIYNGTKYVAGPVSIVKQFKNLDSSVERIDAAFVWGANGKTYLISGNHYWRYNKALGKMDMGYPAKLNESWTGVPNNLDSAMTWINGRTYFFKGNGFWIFNNLDIRTTRTEPMMTNAYWMKCRHVGSSSTNLSASFRVSIVSILTFCLFYQL